MSQDQETTLTQEELQEYNTLKEQQMEFDLFTQEFAKVQKQLIMDSRIDAKKTRGVGIHSDEQIKTYLEKPQDYEKELREISRYLENTNLLYKRLIHYFANISVDAPVVIPTQVDKFEGKIEQIKKQYNTVVKYVDNMKLQNNFIKVKHTMIREDTFYGILYENESQCDFWIKQMNPDYCRISSWEQGCFNFEFNFSFFDSDKEGIMLATYETIIPKFFKSGYAKYQKDKKLYQWQEVPSEKSMCVKFSDHDYSVPYFAGSIRDIIEIDDYKNLEKTSTEQSNYKIVGFEIPMRDDKNSSKPDQFAVKSSTALQFYNMARQSLDDSIGTFITPLSVKPISFKDVNNTKNKVNDAIDEFYKSAGVSQMLFNANNSTSLKMSVKTDEAVVFQMNRQLEAWLNRHISRKFKNMFKVKLLNVTIFNQAEMIDQYLKLSTYGVPVKTSLCAITGQNPLDMVAMNFLENEILDVSSNWKPLSSSHTQTSVDSEGGRPESNDEDLQETGVQTREQGQNQERADV